MHSHPDLTSSVIQGLGAFYLVLFLMNAIYTYFSFKKGGHSKFLERLTGQEIPAAAMWALYSAFLLMIAVAHLTSTSSPNAFLFKLPEWVKYYVDVIVADPVSFSVLSVVLFALMILLREWWVKPVVAWILLNVSVIALGLSMTDWDFRQIVGKPDNVPIVAMLFIVGFFTWLYFRRAIENDKRIDEGRDVFEKEDNEKILVWPDLVYTELMCMVILTVILVAWGILLHAPLEEPGSAVKTPNPSKAPWYFLGLQEMLVYYDPWLAGVVFPSVILVGLMAIPYIDFNKGGNGYYSFKERWFAISTFLFGFLPLWVAMIILGTFLRGPNWNMFGPFEYWDVHKLEVLYNVNLSEYFWLYSPEWTPWVGAMPVAPPDASLPQQARIIFLREAPGFIAVIVYLAVLPPLMAMTLFRTYFLRMGFLRFMVFSNLLLMMLALPIKMVLRWAFNLKYIIAIPEWFINV